MKHRSRISGRGARKLFTATALKTHKANTPKFVSRGGIML